MKPASRIEEPAPRLLDLQTRITEALEAALSLDDERAIDPSWTRACAQVRRYALRPGKRVRPVLSLIGHGLATGQPAPDEDAFRLAAALELLHTFLLIHDDVADRAPSRRGEASLHRVLARGRAGEDLAIVMGDHLFARAMEWVLAARSPRAPAVLRYLLPACRHTAAGQLLDLRLSRVPLADVTLFQTLKVANLKTARYGFVAPLVCGAILGGAGPQLCEALERIGRHAGIAFQLRDDLIGLFGDEATSGKSSTSDYFEGKRTFPLIAAFARADERGRAELTRLWELPNKTRSDFERARTEVERHGGRSASERVILRVQRAAGRAMAALPSDLPAARLLGDLLTQLQARNA